MFFFISTHGYECVMLEIAAGSKPTSSFGGIFLGM